MSPTHLRFSPGPREGTLLNSAGETVHPPEGWSFLPAGDAAVTRKVKAAGPTWIVEVRRGRRTISLGIWARHDDIRRAGKEVAERRAAPGYAERRERERQGRQRQQHRYEEEFYHAVLHFLGFHQRYEQLASRMAREVTAQATPVGSGTVARTSRIPLAERAEAAVIAWMRHRTTPYESMKIARLRGSRRKVRRQLAADSLALLAGYRAGKEPSPRCPLLAVLEGNDQKFDS